MKLEIEDEFADKITYQSLFDTRNGLIDYYHDEKANVFVYGDHEADKKRILEHIEAIELLMEWFGVPGNTDTVRKQFPLDREAPECAACNDKGYIMDATGAVPCDFCDTWVRTPDICPECNNTGYREADNDGPIVCRSCDSIEDLY